MSYSILFEPQYAFSDAALEKFRKLQTNVTKKQISGEGAPSSKAYFCRFHLRGQIVAFFDGAPKTDSPPQYIINIKDIIELKEKNDGGDDVIYVKLVGEEVGLKFDKAPEKQEWLKALTAFKDYYSKDKPAKAVQNEFKEDVTPLMEAKIQAEAEAASFDSIRKNFEYGNFCRDKGFKGLLDIDPRILKNRIIIGQCKFDGKVAPPEMVDKKKLASAKKPAPAPTKNAPKLATDESLYGKSLHVLLVSQKPLCYIDASTLFTDISIMGAETISPPLQFNNLYFYSYEKTGDVTELKKVLGAEYPY